MVDDLTLIIKTRDRYTCLYELLKSIKKYYPKISIFIGDDGIKSMESKVLNDFPTLNISYFNLPYDTGISYGRNVLVKNVKTKYFCLLDDDFVFDKKTNLEKALEIIEQKKVDILGGYLRNYKIRKNLIDRIIFLGEKITGYVIPTNYIGTLEKKENTLYADYKIYSFPKYQESDLVLNFFIANTKRIVENNLWDEDLKIQEHTAFFYNAKLKKLKVAFTSDLSIRHCPIQSKDYANHRFRDYFKVFMEKSNIERVVSTYDDSKRNNEVEHKKNEKIMVSIIVPTYNASEKLSFLFNSLRFQTYKNIEIIFVDNNSKDNSIKMIKEYQKDDKRVILINEKKQGPNYARLAGFKKAKGDYIYFCDSDDILEDDAIYNLVNTVNKYNCDVVLADYNELNNDYSFSRKMIGGPSSYNNLKDDKSILLYKPALWIKLFKKDLISENDFTFTTIGEDMVLSLSIMSKAKSIYHIDKVVYNYVLSDSGLSYSISKDRLIEELITLENLEKVFKENKKYDEYENEIVYIQATHAIYRGVRALLLKNKKDREEVRSKISKYLSNLDYKDNIYYKKSFFYKFSSFVINSKIVYNLGITTLGAKLLFNNKLFNKVLKKLDK